MEDHTLQLKLALKQVRINEVTLGCESEPSLYVIYNDRLGVDLILGSESSVTNVTDSHISLAKSGDSLALLQKDYVSGKNGEKKVIGSFGEWINLRVEYYAVDNGGEKEIRTVVFINDTLLFVSDIPYKNVTGAPEISSVCIKALKGPSATLYIDNLSFRQSADAYSGGDVTYAVE